MSTYDYEKSITAFNEDSLKLEVAADENITTTLNSITSEEGIDENGDPTGTATITFHFESALTSGEETALDSLVAAHTGTPPLVPVYRASSKILTEEKSVTESGPGWEVLGGAVTTPSFFTPNVAACKGRVVGEYKSQGTGAKLRICEDGVDSGQFDVPDTSGAWTKMQWFSTTAPVVGTHTYTIEGQLNDATSCSVRFVDVSLLEFVS